MVPRPAGFPSSPALSRLVSLRCPEQARTSTALRNSRKARVMLSRQPKRLNYNLLHADPFFPSASISILPGILDNSQAGSQIGFCM